MELKYQSEIEALSPCFIGFEEQENRIAYRWVFNSINDANNFLPVPKANPGRNYTDFKDWALSFFETETQSISKLLYHTKDKPQLFKKLGTHIARGVITLADGLAEIDCDEDGHFNHFEYKNTNFHLQFEIISRVPGTE